jgi:hypothetical protein
MVVIYEGSRMMNKVRWRSQARDGHARREVQTLIPSVWPFPPVSRVSPVYSTGQGKGKDGER